MPVWWLVVGRWLVCHNFWKLRFHRSYRLFCNRLPLRVFSGCSTSRTARRGSGASRRSSRWSRSISNLTTMTRWWSVTRNSSPISSQRWRGRPTTTHLWSSKQFLEWWNVRIWSVFRSKVNKNNLQHRSVSQKIVFFITLFFCFRNHSEKSINSILDYISTSKQMELLQNFYETTLDALRDAKVAYLKQSNI